MSLSRKFRQVAATGLLGLSMIAAAGCTQSPRSPVQPQVEAQKADGVFADACIVVDRNPGYPYSHEYSHLSNTYDFRNGVVHFNTDSRGFAYREASTASISTLNDSGKAHAMEMYNKLPASAKCEAPKLK